MRKKRKTTLTMQRKTPTMHKKQTNKERGKRTLREAHLQRRRKLKKKQLRGQKISVSFVRDLFTIETGHFVRPCSVYDLRKKPL